MKNKANIFMKSLQRVHGKLKVKYSDTVSKKYVLFSCVIPPCFLHYIIVSGPSSVFIESKI